MKYDHAIHTTTNIIMVQVAAEFFYVYIKQYRWHIIPPCLTQLDTVKNWEIGYTTVHKFVLTIPEYEKTDQSNINITFNKFLKETPMINTINCF